MIVNHFNEGISNFIGSPSYKSVENIRSVVSSVITRIKRNPEILSKTAAAETGIASDSGALPQELEFPEKVTVKWLVQHVPVKFWVSLIGLLATAFVIGIQASRISLVQEIFRLASGPNTQEVAAVRPHKDGREKTNPNKVAQEGPPPSSAAP